MSSIHSEILPDTYLFLRLPTETLKLIEVKANTIIDAGKLGSFPSNLLIGRPYYCTYELLERRNDEVASRLRIVPPNELNADIVAEDAAPNESRNEPATASRGPDAYSLMGADVVAEMKNNRLTIDDANRQALSQPEIEELKRSAAGKEIIEKILANHAGLDEKTAFSRAKYMLKKRAKYLKRFTALPMDMGNLIQHVLEKEPARILEIREESLGLLTAWSNIHVAGTNCIEHAADGRKVEGGRHLVVDESGGLIVAALAERMGVLFKSQTAPDVSHHVIEAHGIPRPSRNTSAEDSSVLSSTAKAATKPSHRDFPLPATDNALTLLHPAVQPNISLLKYFGYDSNIPDLDHPLHRHLKTLSWLQLLHPEEDPTYQEPVVVSDLELQKWKSGKRGTYFKKRRRWERCKAIVDETRGGRFDGLIVASNMDPVTILSHTLALVRGGGHVVVYSPTPEPLVKLMDLCSKDRRTAFVQMVSKGEEPNPKDFPIDPRLLLASTMQTSRVREWQVLPGRTHPLMTGKGGAEGYIFTARRVIPLQGGVEARGNFSGKRRKIFSEDAPSNGEVGDVHAAP